MIKELFNNIVEPLTSKGVSILNKIRILRYITCFIILFFFIFDNYWNLLIYINFPTIPLLPLGFRKILSNGGLKIALLIIWIFRKHISCIIFKDIKKTSLSTWIIDFFVSIYFVMMALNIGIEYANGEQINILIETLIASFYLLGCIIDYIYNEHDKFLHEINKEYTKYYDCNNCEIAVDDYVIYQRQTHRVFKQKNEYYLSPCNKNFYSSIKLEDAIKNDSKLECTKY